MSLASRSNSFDGTIGNSSIDDCKEVTQYSLPSGHIEDLQLTHDDENLELFRQQNNGYSQTSFQNSTNCRQGDDVTFNIEGHVNVNITTNHVNSQGVVTEDDKEKNEQLNAQDPIPLKNIGVAKRLKIFLKDRPTQFWLAGVLLAIMIISSMVLFFCLYKFNGATIGLPTFGHGDDLGDGIQVIHREEWLARDPLFTRKMEVIPQMIRILHSSSSNCSDYQTCANKVLGLQSEDVAVRGQPDIAYNFLIGGDGNVYIGRGEEVANDERPQSLDIAYVGNYLAPYDKMTEKMNEAGKRLITRLLDKGKISKDYFVVAENQTKTTTSPGENVYKNIVKWPHYDNGSYFEV